MTPALATVTVYAIYLFLHAAFYLPSYLANKLKKPAK